MLIVGRRFSGEGDLVRPVGGSRTIGRAVPPFIGGSFTTGRGRASKVWAEGMVTTSSGDLPCLGHGPRARSVSALGIRTVGLPRDIGLGGENRYTRYAVSRILRRLTSMPGRCTGTMILPKSSTAGFSGLTSSDRVAIGREVSAAPVIIKNGPVSRNCPADTQTQHQTTEQQSSRAGRVLWEQRESALIFCIFTVALGLQLCCGSTLGGMTVLLI